MAAVADQEAADLAKAIAMSLADSAPSPVQSSSTATKRKRAPVIDLSDTEDDDDDDVPPPPQRHRVAASTGIPEPSTAASLGGLAGVDRKAMEEARLARQQQKTASGLLGPSRIRPTATATTQSRVSGMRDLADSDPTPGPSSFRRPQSTAVASNNNVGPLYLDGVVKRTFNSYYPDDPDAVRFEEIIGNVSYSLLWNSLFMPKNTALHASHCCLGCYDGGSRLDFIFASAHPHFSLSDLLARFATRWLLGKASSSV